MESFDTPPALFITIVLGLTLVSMFILGGWGVFFERYQEPKDSD